MAAPSVRSPRSALPLMLLAVVVAACLCGGAAASSESTATGTAGPRSAAIAKADKCRLETDCTANHYCSLSYDAVTDRVIGECRANPFFSNFSWRQGVTIALVFLTAFIAAGSGGTGVGSVHIPVLLSIMALSATESVVSAQAAICGGSLAAIIMYSFEGHPNAPRRSLFDVDAMLVLIPALLVGVLFGGLVQNSMPRWMMYALLLVFASWAAYKIGVRTTTMWKAETAAKLESDAIVAAASGDASALKYDVDALPAPESQVVFLWHQNDVATAPAPGESASERESRLALLQRKPEEIPNISNFWYKLVGVLLVAGVLAACEVFRGGHSAHINLVDDTSVVGIERCSRTYWIFTGVEAAVAFSFSIVCAIVFLQQTRVKREENEFTAGVDLEWTASAVALFPLLAFIAGTCTGALGAGIGVITAVIMLELGMNPQSVAATSALLHLLGSSGVVISTAVSGQLLLGYSVALFAVSFLGQVAGKFVFDYVMRRLGRPSLVVIAMAVMLAMAITLLVTLGIEKTIDDVRTGENLSFQPIGNC